MKKILMLLMIMLGVFWTNTVFAETSETATGDCMMVLKSSDTKPSSSILCKLGGILPGADWSYDFEIVVPDSGNVDYSKYMNDIFFKVTYEVESKKLVDWKPYNILTREEITDFSEDGLEALVDVGRGKIAQEKEWVETFDLSSLEEGKLYKYIASDDSSSFPEIENDTGKNAMVYVKSSNALEEGYQKGLYLGNDFSSSFDDNSREYSVGEYFLITYKILDTNLTLNLLSDWQVTNMSSYNIGDSLSYQRHGQWCYAQDKCMLSVYPNGYLHSKSEYYRLQYLYNDTGKDIVLRRSYLFFGEIKFREYVIAKNAFRSFEDALNYAVVDIYYEDVQHDASDPTLNESANVSNKEENTNTEENTNIEVNNSGTEINNPDTGVHISVFIIVGLLVVSLILFVVSTRNKIFNRI